MKIEIELDDLTNLQNALVNKEKSIQRLTDENYKISKHRALPFVSKDEFWKAIDALRKKYNISECETLPYYPEFTYLMLTGTTV